MSSLFLLRHTYIYIIIYGHGLVNKYLCEIVVEWIALHVMLRKNEIYIKALDFRFLINDICLWSDSGRQGLEK